MPASRRGTIDLSFDPPALIETRTNDRYQMTRMPPNWIDWIASVQALHGVSVEFVAFQSRGQIKGAQFEPDCIDVVDKNHRLSRSKVTA